MRKYRTGYVRTTKVHHDNIDAGKYALISLSAWLRNNKQPTRSLKHQANTIAFLEETPAIPVLAHTPPQVEKYLCRNKTRSLPRTARHNPAEQSQPASSYSPHLDVAQKAPQYPSPDLIPSSSQDTVIRQILLLYRTSQGMYRGDDILCQQNISLLQNDRTYRGHNERSKKLIVCRIRKHTNRKTLIQLLAGDDKKKKENQPKPDKPNQDKPKPEREGDKGSRRVKRPRV